MNAIRRTGAGLAVGCVLAAAGPAHAALMWGWGFEDWTPTVGQTESVTLNATLYNAVTSTEHITWSSLQGFWAGDVAEGLYVFTAPSVGLAQQFAGMDLAPGESFDFVFGSYVPSAPPVDEGVYLGGGYAIQMRDAAGGLSSWTPDRDYWITVVAQDDPPAGVPEPASWGLLAAGLGALGWSRRQRR